MTARARGSLTDNVGTVDAERAPAYGLQLGRQLRKLEGRMSRRVVTIMAAVAMMLGLVFLRLVASAQSAGPQSAQVSSPDTKSKAASKPWTPPRTPWGHPDLQGVWDYRTITPLERP